MVGKDVAYHLVFSRIFFFVGWSLDSHGDLHRNWMSYIV